MKRRVLVLCGLALLVFLAGCPLGGGGGEISEDDLTGEAEYDWETNATASFTLQDSDTFSFSSATYAAVVEVTNQSTVSVHEDSTFRGDQSIGLGALRFRFLNGTVVNATHPNLTAIKQSDQTDIELPAANGTVAYTSGRSGKSWSTPVIVEGSHQVTLPGGTRVGIPLLSEVSPGGYDSTVEDNRMTLRWEELDGGSISIRYYLVRDLYLFGGLLALALLLAGGGALYYLRQIRRARRKRQEVGLDVEVEDDDVGGDGPPPGMR
jgi:hypothetical protein